MLVEVEVDGNEVRFKDPYVYLAYACGKTHMDKDIREYLCECMLLSMKQELTAATATVLSKQKPLDAISGRLQKDADGTQLSHSIQIKDQGSQLANVVNLLIIVHPLGPA